MIWANQVFGELSYDLQPPYWPHSVNRRNRIISKVKGRMANYLVIAILNLVELKKYFLRVF